MALSVLQPRSFLTLVQDLFRECGCAGVAPVTTVNQTGEALRLVNWIHDADLDLQNLWVDWKFLRVVLPAFLTAGSNVGIVTTQGGAVNAQPADLAEWDYRTFQIFPAGSVTPQDLVVAEWQSVRWDIFDLTDLTQPWRVIVMPDNTLRWDLTPDQSYAVQMEYRKQPYDLKLDADVSIIPPRFANRLIVEWARLKYGMFENAAEQVTAAKAAIYGMVNDSGVMTMPGLLAQLENDQLPNAKNSRLQQGNQIVVGSGNEDWGDRQYGRYEW